MEVTFFHRTYNGYDWLSQTYFVTESNYKQIIEMYMIENKDRAQSLLDHWSKDGEENGFFLDFIFSNGNRNNQEMFNLINNYIEDKNY
jgi:hypothetical protein